MAGDAIRVREALTGASSTWEIRLRMAAMGWLSQTRIMDERRGGACFQIWFKRQDWHGRLSEVTFHSGCQVPLDRGDGCGAGGDTAAMHAEAIDAALRATDAWDRFPDSIPCQMPDHTTVDSGYRTAQAFGPDSRGVHPRGFPTERLHDLDSLLDGGSPEADGLLLRACRLAALGMYHDDLSPYRWSSPGWHIDRRWGFEHAVSFPEWNGVRTDCRPVKQSTPELSAAFVHALLDASFRTFRGWLGTYGPGSPRGELPPCLHHSKLPLFNAERQRQREDLLADPGVLAREPAAVEAMAARWDARRVADPVLAREWCTLTEEHVVLALDDLGPVPDAPAA